MYLKLLTILSVLTFGASSVGAQDNETAIRESLESVLPGMNVDEIQESVLPGVYTVVIGAEIFYVSADGQYLLRGDLIDLPNKSNLSEEKRTVARRGILAKVPEQEFITFASADPQHTIYVFTDITCGFCQKLQHDIADINNKGITVNYLAFPREGMQSSTSKRMEAVWCSENPRQAFVDSMIGLDLDAATCTNPVAEHFGLGQAMGVRGTPAIFTEDGRYLPGYLPPDELLQAVSKTN